MSDQTEFVSIRTDIFQLQQDLHDQRVKDFKNHLDFQFSMRKQEMENIMAQAEAISEARFQMAHGEAKVKRWKTVVKLVLLVAVIACIYFLN